MKALLSTEVGGPETLVLDDIPSPEAGSGQVVISVKAIGVNFPDSLIIKDMYQFKPPRPFSPGGEVSGIVKAVGDGVTHLKVGQHVIGSSGWDGMREELALDASRCILIPDSVPFDEAAAFVLTYGTSHYALKHRADPKPGEKLFILGAAGGVGVAAIELGKVMGLEVIAGVSSQEKLDFCLSKGADKGLIYPRGPLDKDQQKTLSNEIKSLSGGGVDIIYDAVGGDYAEPSLRAMNWEGRYLVIGFPAGIPKLPLNLTLLKSCDVRGVFWGAWVARDPKGNEAAIKELFQLYGEGKIKPHISGRFTLADGGKAIQHLMDRKAMGKVVVVV